MVMDKEAYERNVAFLRAHKKAYPFHFATKKKGLPSAQIVCKVFPQLDFKRVPFSAHIWWAFRNREDRERFIDWLRFNPSRDHPTDLMLSEHNLI